jgi:hypothetical protein
MTNLAHPDAAATHSAESGRGGSGPARSCRGAPQREFRHRFPAALGAGGGSTNPEIGGG